MTGSSESSRGSRLLDESPTLSSDEKIEAEVVTIVQRFPDRRAALLPVLWLCQDRWGWISPTLMEEVAERLGFTAAHVYGVVTFHRAFRTTPDGNSVVEVCSALSCHLCGADRLMQGLAKHLAIEPGETSHDGRFTLRGVQCFGACASAPVVRINREEPVAAELSDVAGIIDRLASPTDYPRK